jgi:hypothetical protein
MSDDKTTTKYKVTLQAMAKEWIKDQPFDGQITILIHSDGADGQPRAVVKCASYSTTKPPVWFDMELPLDELPTAIVAAIREAVEGGQGE